MKEIPLTQGKVALVDDEDFEWLNQWKWYYTKLANRNTGYAKRKPRKNEIAMHTMVMDTPKNMVIDHRDHDGCNNQRSNLRNCTHTENKQNRLINKNNKAGYIGVSWHKCSKKWRAQISVTGKKIHLGIFANPEDAACAYDTAALKFHGKFANINSI